MKSIRIIFLPLYSNLLPSSRYRVYQILEPLSKLGYECRILSAPEGNFRKRIFYLLRLYSMAHWAHIIYVQKRGFPNFVLNSLLRLNSNLIYDFDDAVYLRPKSYPNAITMIQRAKRVIAGNEILAHYARKNNPQVTVLPTVVDSTLYYPTQSLHHPEEKRLVLGWIGIDPNRGDFNILKPVFPELERKYKNQIVLRIVSNYRLQMEVDITTQFIPWSLEKSRYELQQFDVGLMPLEDTEWNRGKCAFKLIQYMAVGIPAVASNVGANREVIEDGATGFLAATQQDWVEKLSWFIENPKLRQHIGKLGRERVLHYYCVDAVLPKLVQIFEETLE